MDDREMAFKTYVKCDDGETYLIDTIRHEGLLWLVPKWTGTINPNMQKTVRLIPIDSLARTDLGHDFLGTGHHVLKLDDPIPISVLDGTCPSQVAEHYGVVEKPELWIRR
jgi:hypothetical protein